MFSSSFVILSILVIFFDSSTRARVCCPVEDQQWLPIDELDSSDVVGYLSGWFGGERCLKPLALVNNNQQRLDSNCNLTSVQEAERVPFEVSPRVDPLLVALWTQKLAMMPIEKGESNSILTDLDPVATCLPTDYVPVGATLVPGVILYLLLWTFLLGVGVILSIFLMYFFSVTGVNPIQARRYDYAALGKQMQPLLKASLLKPTSLY
jgi:hypothetical protein